jgi:outer membrane receptor protein involved in Fe transport
MPLRSHCFAALINWYLAMPLTRRAALNLQVHSMSIFLSRFNSGQRPHLPHTRRTRLIAATVFLSATAAHADSAPLEEVVVTAARLDAARNGLSPSTGSSQYKLDSADLADLPLGNSTPLNQAMLQAPGAAQDSFGQLHVRGDHANLQYRINGVVIPEAISGFGQALDTRAANRVSLLTGALPAQYGYRTAGVIDIQTKGYVPDNQGSVTVTGGSHDDKELGADLTGSSGAFSYSLIGSYLQNNLGIENPTDQRNALHDHTEQGKGFGYLSYILNNDSRVNVMFGISDNRFEIPNTPNQTPDFTLNGTAAADSATLNARQNERNRFEALTYQAKSGDDFNYQMSLFERHTDVHYLPDDIGDLQFFGIAANVKRQDEEVGVQADSSWRINDSHTMRSGLFMNHERFTTDNHSLVFPADSDGNQTDTTPLGIVDNTQIAGHTWGVYLQDEWQALDKLVINYGARYDKVRTVVDEQQFSPRLGMIYDVTPDVHLHVGYARYFTPPPTEKIDTTSIALFQNTTNALPSDANTAVKSERSHYFDAGITVSVTKQITLGLDSYYRKVTNLQDEGQFGNALIFSAFNYAQGRVYGSEFTASYVGDHFSAYTNLAYSLAQARQVVTGQFNFDPDELDYIANHWVHVDHDQRLTGSAGASYKWTATSVSADLLYGSGLRRGFANTENMPAYTQLNLAVTQDLKLPGIGNFTTRLSMLNILDHAYQLRDGSGIGVGAPQYGPRRAVYLGATKEF